jgi:hypothetical protein
VSIDANSGALSITPTVSADTAGKGVNLALNPVTGCGTLSVASANSGAAFNFNPPTTITSSCTVNLTATSISDGTKSATLALTVYPALTLPAASTSVPGSATQGAPYTGYLNAGGGEVPGNFTWTVSGLSNNLTSNAAGNTGGTLSITGTPTAATPVTFTAKVTDATGFSVGPISYTIAVNTYTAVSLPGGSLPNATVGQSNYNAGINALGGIGTYTFTVTVGPVPYGVPTNNTPVVLGSTGLSANNSGGNTLFITGSPAGAAGSTITLQVAVVDGENNPAYGNYTIAVNAVSTIVINTDDLEIPQGMATMPYSASVNNNNAISGGTQPYSFSYTGLPTWASYDQYGNITGTPSSTDAAISSVTVTVKDSSTPQNSKSATFNLTVVPLTTNANNAMLSGQYACSIHYINDSPTTVGSSSLSVGAIALAFKSDGGGNITHGEADTNDAQNGYQNAATTGDLTGTYRVGADNRGYLIIGPASASHPGIFALSAGVVSGGYYSELRLAEMDDAGATPSGQHGGGLCFKQYDKTGTTTLNGETVSGGYVFLQNGESSDGQWETGVGSIFVTTSGSASGSIDMASGSTPNLGHTFSGATVSSADAWGRITFTCTSCESSVFYITNQKLGQGVFMTTDSHSTGNDLLWGQLRQQNATNIAKPYPLTGKFVMYASGLDTHTPANSKSLIIHGSGSSGAATITIDADATNDAGTLKLNNNLGSSSYTVTSTTTGRLTLGKTGDVMYLYNTNEAVVLLADTGNGAGSPAQNMVGWLETQVAPSSGTWALTDLAGSYFMGDMYSPSALNGSGTNTGDFTVNSAGAFTAFAQDQGNQNSADWDEGIAGGRGGGGTYTGAVAPDTTLDPSGAYGIYDINVTQGTTTSTQVYCFAASVNTTTGGTGTYGRMVCMDGSDSSAKLTILSQ